MATIIPQSHLAGMSDIRRAKFFELHKGKKFNICDGEQRMYWRPGGRSYTPKAKNAGKYALDVAWRLTTACGAEKKISFVEVT